MRARRCAGREPGSGGPALRVHVRAGAAYGKRRAAPAVAAPGRDADGALGGRLERAAVLPAHERRHRSASGRAARGLRLDRRCRSALSWPRHRAHPARGRSPAVRLRPAPARTRPLDADQDHHGIHARAQHHPRARHARLRRRAGSAGRRGHRAQHHVSWRRDPARAAGSARPGREQALDRRLRLRSAARTRLRRRAHRAWPGTRRNPARAPVLQHRGGNRSADVRRRVPRARLGAAPAEGELAALGGPTAGVRYWHARRVLVHRAHERIWVT